MNKTEIIPILKKLRMSGVLESLELRTRQAVDDRLPYPEFLFRLLSDEVERRETKQLELRFRRASFENAKRLLDFDFAFNPLIPKSKIIDLATCQFISRHECVLFVGQAGTGKSHIAQAIGNRACRANHTVYYTTANKMFTVLRAARADRSLEKAMLKLTRPDLLIIDDLGLRPLRNEEPLDFYEIIRERYEKGSLIVTSNRAIDEWYPLFGDELLASAAMDRLLHHSHVVEMIGESFRNPKSKHRVTAAK